MTVHHAALGHTDWQLTAMFDAASLSQLTKLSRADTSALLAFYVGLDDAESYARFGGTVTAAALSAHCRTLDWANTAVFAWTEKDVVAIVEVHLSTPDHAAVELAVACADRHQPQSIWRQ